MLSPALGHHTCSEYDVTNCDSDDEPDEEVRGTLSFVGRYTAQHPADSGVRVGRTVTERFSSLLSSAGSWAFRLRAAVAVSWCTAASTLRRVREWLFRRAGFRGVMPVTLACSVVPVCPPGPAFAAASATRRS